jgi:hypothetical protein
MGSLRGHVLQLGRSRRLHAPGAEGHGAFGQFGDSTTARLLRQSSARSPTNLPAAVLVPRSMGRCPPQYWQSQACGPASARCVPKEIAMHSMLDTSLMSVCPDFRLEFLTRERTAQRRHDRQPPSPSFTRSGCPPCTATHRVRRSAPTPVQRRQRNAVPTSRALPHLGGGGISYAALALPSAICGCASGLDVRKPFHAQ